MVLIVVTFVEIIKHDIVFTIIIITLMTIL